MSQRVMRPTTPPSWLAWYRRMRPMDLPRAADLTPAGRVAVYTSVFRRDQPLPYLTFEDMLGHKRPLPTMPHEWLKRFNLDQEMWRAHVAPDLAKDSYEYHQRFHNYSPAAGAGAGSARRGAGGGAGGAVWGGWAAGAVLLALLVLVVRAAEKCLDRKLFTYTRRPSEEWHTPNVTATSLQHQSLDASMPNLDDSEFASPNHQNSDLPPPYSECAPTNNRNVKPHNKMNNEEPPPPYSACVVTFSNKDVPTVHIQREIEPRTSSEQDNIQNNIIEDRQRNETTNNDDSIRVELVFDNGRVVERTMDVATQNVPDLVANVGETVLGNKSEDSNVPYVDNVEASSQDRVIFV